MRKNVFLILIMITIGFAAGFGLGVKKLFPYNLAKVAYGALKNSKSKSNLEECNIETLEKLPDSFTVFIGHAYGSPLTSEMSDFIAPKVENFLLNNRSLIQHLIFTGDVFSVPSQKKWEQLFSTFSDIKIHIAPGNHDILRPDSKEIFERQTYIKQEYPYFLEESTADIIISDSISSNWQLGQSLDSIIKESSSDLIISRHNIVVSELSQWANSTAGGSTLPTAQDLAKSIGSRPNITWVIGDGGAFKHLPRLTCLKFENHRFIINGIGEIDDDLILILHKGEIYSYQLIKEAKK